MCFLTKVRKTAIKKIIGSSDQVRNTIRKKFWKSCFRPPVISRELGLSLEIAHLMQTKAQLLTYIFSPCSLFSILRISIQ